MGGYNTAAVSSVCPGREVVHPKQWAAVGGSSNHTHLEDIMVKIMIEMMDNVVRMILIMGSVLDLNTPDPHPITTLRLKNSDYQV